MALRDIRRIGEIMFMVAKLYGLTGKTFNYRPQSRI
jgi:hypothetical protein